MSSYPPPNSKYSVYNSANFTYATDSITLEKADARYLKLTGGIELGSVAFSAGLSSVGAITISNNNASTSSTTGAIQSLGGAYLGNSSIINNQLSVIGTGSASSLSNLKFNSYDTVNSYIQNNIQNLSSGTSASSDWIATCNNGSDTTGFVDMGINSSGFTTAIGAVSDSYLYCVSDLSSNGGNLWIGTQSPKLVYLFANTSTPTASNSISFDGSTFKTIGLKVGLNGTTYNQELYGNFTLTTPNIVALGSTTQIVSFSTSFASAPNVLANVSYTSTAGTSMNFLIITVFSVSTSQCTITITNTHPAVATTGSVAISWKAFA